MLFPNIVAIPYNGRNLKTVLEAVRNHLTQSMATTDVNDTGKRYINTAVPFGEAMEEFPQVGDVYVIHTDTQEFMLYTSDEWASVREELV